MLIYDVDKIENLYQDFERCQKDFKNKEYDDFSSSYFYSCSDSVIVKLRNRIQTIYNNIQKGYDMIDKVWKEYVDDVGNFDKSIASGGNCGIHDGGVSSIVSKICSIELYDTAGVSNSFKSIVASGKGIGSEILNALKRTGASILNTVFSIISGLLKFVEGIVDCVVLVVGAVVGLVVLVFDAGASLVMGDKRNGIDATKKYFNKLLQCIGYDIVERQIKDRLYSTKFGKWVNDNSYAPFKNGGIGYKIGEAVGEIIGTVVLTVATMGGGAAVSAAKTAATSGTKLGVKAASKIALQGAKQAVKSQVLGVFGKKAAEKTVQVGTKKIVLKTATELLKKTGKSQVAAFAVRGAGIMGKKTQENYNSLITNGAEKGNLSGSQIAKLVATSGVQAGADAAAYSLTYAGGLKTLGKLDKVSFLKNTKVGNAVTTAANTVGKSKRISGVINNGILKHESLSKAGIQVAKTFANDGVAAAGDIKKFNIKETATDAAINAGVSIGYDFTFGKAFKAMANATDGAIAAKSANVSNASSTKLDTNVSMAPVEEAVEQVAENAKNPVTEVLKKIPTPILKTANKFTSYSGSNADGKKVIGTAIKKIPTNITDEVLDF